MHHPIICYWLHTHIVMLTPKVNFFPFVFLVPVFVAQVDTGFLDSLDESLLTLPNPDSGVVLLLVGLVGTIGVTNLSHEVVLLLEDEVTDTAEVSPLGVSVNVHLNNAVDNSLSDLILGRTGTTVEDKVPDQSSQHCLKITIESRGKSNITSI